MATKITKWFSLAAVIAVMGISFLASPAFAEGQEGTPKEGIKVHGHWKIEIFNPDGTRVSVTEFENALDSSSGASYLIQLLSGNAVHGSWGIALGQFASATQPCDDGAGTSIYCRIGESGGFYGGVVIHSSNLAVNAEWSTTPRKIDLSGSVTATDPSTIDLVMTTASYCTSATDPVTCKTNNNNIWQIFTQATLGTPPSVVAGQLIQVTVTITFS